MVIAFILVFAEQIVVRFWTPAMPAFPRQSSKGFIEEAIIKALLNYNFHGKVWALLMSVELTPTDYCKDQVVFDEGAVPSLSG